MFGYVIRKVMEHYEVYKDGQFQFSADSLQEIAEEMNHYDERD